MMISFRLKLNDTTSKEAEESSLINGESFDLEMLASQHSPHSIP